MKSFIVFLFLFFVRCLNVYFSSLPDCDETFNYFEPSHYITFGYGLQTWEYSPVYAIRSWIYIYITVLISQLFQWREVPHYYLFYGIKTTFALVSSLCEWIFLKNIKNVKVQLFTFVFFISSTGMSLSQIGI
jgi:alpha-1,2-mannosyltransferase